MMKNTILFSLLFVIAISFSGCGEDGPGDGNGDDSTVVSVTDDVTEITTWYADSLYLIEDWIYVSNTLQIEPGTIIKFKATDDAIYLEEGGTIIADATREEPIIFTSYKDDEHGGDTNGDGDALAPARGDWESVETQGYNGSVFNYCEFHYGGSGTYSGALVAEGRNIEVTNCTFVNNGAGDPGSTSFGALNASHADEGCVITGNVFYNNESPMAISMAMDIDDSNHFHKAGSPEITNDYNGIFVEDHYVKTNLSWAETEVAFVLDNFVYLAEEGTLSLANNVCLKFRADAELIADATDAIINSNGPGVVFTSFKDDTDKGDTNGDGDLTSPGDGDWSGIYDNETGNYFSWTNIFYAAN